MAIKGKCGLLLAGALLLLPGYSASASAAGQAPVAERAAAVAEQGPDTAGHVSPAAEQTPHAAKQDLPVVEQDLLVQVDGKLYPGRVRLEEGTAWVSLREFSLFADSEASVEWDNASRTATVRTDALLLTAAEGGRIIEANGRLLFCPDELYIGGASLWVPLRTTARAFGFSCAYDPAVPAAVLSREGEAVPARDEEEEDRVFWLSRIIEAEAGAEPFEGKLAVGSVILNRMLSDEFPDTVWGVIFDDRNGVQFTPAENGAIWQDPGEESVRAACVTLDNPPLWDDIEYFLNPDIAESLWIPAAREYAFTIGGHAFYR